MHATIIAKSPVAGQVKTRLCPPCTHEQAATIARAALDDTMRAVDAVCNDVRIDRVLLLAGDPQQWMLDSFRIVQQRGDGLGERLGNGFRELGAGVIVGMETPHAVPWLRSALDAVADDVDVIGLATDGGYWTIGLGATSAARAADVFAGVPMSSSHTGLAQLRRMHQLGRPVRLLPMARDLDTVADLSAVATSGREGALAKAAKQVLASL